MPKRPRFPLRNAIATFAAFILLGFTCLTLSSTSLNAIRGVSGVGSNQILSSLSSEESNVVAVQKKQTTANDKQRTQAFNQDSRDITTICFNNRS